MPTLKSIKKLAALLTVTAACLVTVATSPPVDPEPNPGLEEPDSEPCGEATSEPTPYVTHLGDQLMAEDRLTIAVGGSSQGGDGDEQISIYVHLDGVRSDESTVTNLELSLTTDDGETVAEHIDAEGGFYCFGGEFRTRILDMPIQVDSFDLDGQTGQLQFSLELDSELLTYTLDVSY